MHEPIFPILYLGPIDYLAQLAKYQQTIFENHEHYPKQTYRNRCTIHGPNGKQTLKQQNEIDELSTMANELL